MKKNRAYQRSQTTVLVYSDNGQPSKRIKCASAADARALERKLRREGNRGVYVTK